MKRHWLGIGLLSGLVIVGTVSVRLLDDAPANQNAALNLPSADACLSGETMSLDEAGRRVDYLLVPDHEMASKENLTASWICFTEDEKGTRRDAAVRLIFSNEIRVSLSLSDLSDPAALWTSLAAQQSDSSVGMVRDNDAWLVEPSPEGQGRTGRVEFVEGPIRVVLTGNGEATLSDLIAIAESLQRHRP